MARASVIRAIKRKAAANSLNFRYIVVATSFKTIEHSAFQSYLITLLLNPFL